MSRYESTYVEQEEYLYESDDLASINFGLCISRKHDVDFVINNGRKIVPRSS